MKKSPKTPNLKIVIALSIILTTQIICSKTAQSTATKNSNKIKKTGLSQLKINKSGPSKKHKAFKGTKGTTGPKTKWETKKLPDGIRQVKFNKHTAITNNKNVKPLSSIVKKNVARRVSTKPEKEIKVKQTVYDPKSNTNMTKITPIKHPDYVTYYPLSEVITFKNFKKNRNINSHNREYDVQPNLTGISIKGGKDIEPIYKNIQPKIMNSLSKGIKIDHGKQILYVNKVQDPWVFHPKSVNLVHGKEQLVKKKKHGIDTGVYKNAKVKTKKYQPIKKIYIPQGRTKDYVHEENADNQIKVTKSIHDRKVLEFKPMKKIRQENKTESNELVQKMPKEGILFEN